MKPTNRLDEIPKWKTVKYQVGHSTYSSAISEVMEQLKKQGLFLEKDDVWREISTGPKKPAEGKTNRFNFPLYTKDGSPSYQGIAFQVFNKGTESNTYELNMYVQKWSKKDFDKNAVVEIHSSLKNMKIGQSIVVSIR